MNSIINKPTAILIFLFSLLVSSNSFGQAIPNKGPIVGILTTVSQDGCGCTFTKVKGDKKTIFVSTYGNIQVRGEDYVYMVLNGKVERFIPVKTIKNITIYYNDTYIITQTAKPSKKTGEEVSEESGVLEIEVRRPPIGQPGNYITKVSYFGECGC